MGCNDGREYAVSVVGEVQLNSIPLTDPAGQYTLTNPEDILTRTVRANDTPHPTGHGTIFGADRLDARKITFNITVHADPDAFVATLDTLSTLFAPTDDTVELAFRMYESEQWRTLRGRPRNYNVDTGVYGVAQIKAEFVCADPRMYGATHDVALLASEVRPAGQKFPQTFPVTFSAYVASGADSGSIPNNGNFAAPYTIYIYNVGGAQNPTIVHESGKFLRLAATIPDGACVVLSSADRSALCYFSGTPDPSVETPANVYHWLSANSQWFTLTPGTNSFFFADSGGAVAYATVACVDTWI